MSQDVRHLALRLEEMPHPEQWNFLVAFNESKTEYAISTGAAVNLIEGLSGALGEIIGQGGQHE